MQLDVIDASLGPHGRLCALRRSFTAVAALGLFVLAAPTQAQPSAPGRAASGEALNEALVSLSREHARSDRAAEVRAELFEVAAGRRELMAALVAEDPGEVLRLALPADVRNRLPVAARKLVERAVDVEGEFTVLYEEGEGWSRLRHVLVDARGTRRSVHFAEDPPDLLSGDRVRVRGVAVPLESGSEFAAVVAYCCEGDGVESIQAAELPNSFGEQRTAVLLVNFQDDPQQPWTLEQARGIVFGTASDFYLENSSGQTWLSGDVHGWYTLPFDRPTDPSACKSTEVAQGAQQAAQNAGVDLSAFDRYVYVFPQTPCFPSGSATVGGNPSEAWINGNWFSLKTVGHELGHNLGLYHSGALECGETTLGIDCQTFVYGDVMDIMGNQSVGHFNAFQKERLGWLDPNVGDIAIADAAGIFALEAHEAAVGSVPKAVKVPKHVDPVSGETTWYYVEYRQALGFDDFLAGNDNVLNGVVVHMASDSEPTSSVLLDMTPNSSATWDWGDPALTLGASFVDPDAGVTLSVAWADSSGAGVVVALAAPGCVPANPAVTLSPSESQSAAAGTPVTYRVEVSNADNAGCTGSDFDLTASIPEGWTAVYEMGTFFLEPGTSASTNLHVTSSSSAPDGSYAVEATARNASDPGYSGSGFATHVVGADAGNGAPVARDDSAETVQRTPVMIDVLDNDSDPDNDPLTVTAVTQGSKGSVGVDAHGMATYTPNGKAKGQDSFSYTVSDGMGHTSATVHISIQRSSGGGGTATGNGKGKKK